MNYQSNLSLCTQGLNVTHGFWGSLCDSSNTSSEMNDLPGFCQTIWSKLVRRELSEIEWPLFGTTWPEIFQCESGISWREEHCFGFPLERKGRHPLRKKEIHGRRPRQAKAEEGSISQQGLPCLEHAPGWMPPTWACPMPPSSYSRPCPLTRYRRDIPAAPPVDCFEPGDRSPVTEPDPCLQLSYGRNFNVMQ